ncbi:MAG: purine-nucleoside phosphorylase, partial [Solirubrobacterales bacterium]
MALYLKPTAPIAPSALLPSDPGTALALAQDLLDEPRMSNHSHGLWGYHGETESGAELTIQSTGIGGPSAAIVLSELTELG